MRIGVLVVLSIFLVTLATMLEFYPTPAKTQKSKVSVIVNLTPKHNKAIFHMKKFSVALINFDKKFLGKNITMNVTCDPNTMIFLSLYNKKNETSYILRRFNSFNFTFYYNNTSEKIIIYSPVNQKVKVVAYAS